MTQPTVSKHQDGTAYNDIRMTFPDATTDVYINTDRDQTLTMTFWPSTICHNQIRDPCGFSTTLTKGSTEWTNGPPLLTYIFYIGAQLQKVE